jgi:hypothetical protein
MEVVPSAAVVRGAVPDAILFYLSGYGDSHGDGYGSGYGHGHGYGDGSGYGHGDGYGSGYGYGYGYGDGSGDGHGSEEYWLSTVDAFASKWSDSLRERLATLRRDGAKIAFWRSDDRGRPSNGGKKIEAAAPGVVHTAPGPLNLCNPDTLHATLFPPKWKGERWWIVALIGEVIGDETKYGTLRREIIGEAL